MVDEIDVGWGYNRDGMGLKRVVFVMRASNDGNGSLLTKSRRSISETDPGVYSTAISHDERLA